MSYREAKLARAREAASEIAENERIDAVYLAGSLTAGLGSPTSDVDLFAIASDGHDAPTRQISIDGERIDVETYALSWYEDALARLGDWRISRTDLRSKALSPDDLDVLLRMRQCEVIKDSPSFEKFRELLSQHSDQLRRMALSLWALDVNAHLSDFLGSHRDGDHETAGLIGQSLLVGAGKAVAAAADDLYQGQKWVYCQLRRSAGPAFPLERFAHLQSGAWAWEDPVNGAVDVVNLTQTLAVAAQVLGWAGSGVTEWPFWAPGPGPYRRNPDFNPIHLTDGVLLNHELTAQFVVRPHLALIWGLCNGRDEQEIIDAALNLGPSVIPPGQPPLTPQRVGRILATLESQGLVSGRR